MLRHSCILGDPQLQARGAKSVVVPNKGKQNQKRSPTTENKIRSGCLTFAFSGAHKRAEMLRNPCILGNLQRQARGTKPEVVPNKQEQNQKWLPHPCLPGGPKEGENATSALHSRGSPTKRIKIQRGCHTLAFSEAQKRAEMLCHPCILGGPQGQARRAKSKVAASPLLSQGPKRGRKYYIGPAFSEIPDKGEQNLK